MAKMLLVLTSSASLPHTRPRLIGTDQLPSLHYVIPMGIGPRLHGAGCRT